MFGGTRPVQAIALDGDRAAECARLHAAAFLHPWDEHDFERLIGADACFGDAAVDARGRALLGFILSRRAADEAEVLTVTVDPACRRQGIASKLLAANLDRLGRRGVKTVVLEVGEDNVAARRLYARFGFAEVSRRQGYYRTAKGPPATALVLRCSLG